MTAADFRYQTPYGDFELARYPARRNETLRAWCAADTLLLEEAYRLNVPGHETLVVNDEHGALSIPLQPARLWTDSALAARSLRDNALRNGLEPTTVTWSTATPDCAASLVLLRVPKQLAYFEYQLSVLASCVAPGTIVLAAGMDKHLSPKTAQLMESRVGTTRRHRGRHKARLFSATSTGRSPAALEHGVQAQYFCPELAAELCALPNVFSRDSLDIGSRFLLQQLPKLLPTEDILADLACGNGVLGLAAYRQKLAARVLFCDESAMAVDSAHSNCTRLFPDRQEAFSFHHGDGLQQYPGQDIGLILCNPPFHLNHVVDDLAGRHLLAQCAAHLVPAGRLCLVANRHLDYHHTLKRDFRQVDLLAQNAKFKVWLAHKS